MAEPCGLGGGNKTWRQEAVQCPHQRGCQESESTRASATAQAEAEQIPSHTLSGSFSNFSKATDFQFLLRFLFAQRKKEDGIDCIMKCRVPCCPHTSKLCNHPGTWVLLCVAGAGAVESRQNQVQILFLTLGSCADLMLDKGMACLFCFVCSFLVTLRGMQCDHAHCVAGS